MILRFFVALIWLLIAAACQSAAASTPSPEAETLVYPTLNELDPVKVVPGATVKVIASGGYIRLAGGGVNESARDFDLLFDGEVVGKLSCYINACFADLAVPEDAAVGEHTLSTEGGSSLMLEVVTQTPSAKVAGW